MSYELNDSFTVHSVTGYRDLEEYRVYDFDASAADYITIERWNEYDQFSQEFRLDGTWDNFSLTTGVYYWNSEFEQDWSTGGDFWASSFGPVIGNPAGYDLCLADVFALIACDSGLTTIPPGSNIHQILFETQETTSTAVFAQGDWHINDKWTLTAGLRWTEEENEFVAGQSYLTTPERERLPNFPEYVDLKNKWTETWPKIGVTYQLSDDAIVYLSWAKGFHSGGSRYPDRGLGFR